MLRAMVSRARRWTLWLTIAVGILGALLVAQRREPPGLSKAKQEGARIEAHAVHRYDQRNCALASYPGRTR
jgi:hypothetical protein